MPKRKQQKPVYAWPDGTTAEELVQYYDQGWRYGYILDVDKRGAKIKPIGGYHANPNPIHVPVTDVRKV